MMSMDRKEDAMQGIAIIGMSGRFPGASTVEEFWQNLRDGVESISIFTDVELAEANISQDMQDDPNFVPAAGVMKDPEYFDAAFFDIIPREAEVTDPQQRLFLECAHEAIEHAGYDPSLFDGSVGVYGGVGRNSYINHLHANPQVVQSVGSFQAMIGNDPDFLATRVSYKLNLQGPSVTVQTACSTSLVAVHLACQGLLTYECDMALAGGVSVDPVQKQGYLYQEGGILSPDGHCRAFDDDAQGTIVGNGVGVVLLKRLEDAVADGDTIYAVIKGSAINNDGSNKTGYTAPSVDEQARVIVDALAIAEVDADTISYVEAHGTGTPIGDPIEITALTEAYRASTDEVGYCAIGSVKTNIGHLNTAAGVTSLIKTTLALRHQELPPSLHFEKPNKKIDFANSPFYVNASLQEWKTDGTPRRAGVSSFGIGGTNAHAVLEEAPLHLLEPTSEEKPWNLLVLSAKTSTALEQATSNLADYLQNNHEVSLSDVAYTLQVGRRAFNHRRTLVCRDLEDARNLLAGHDANRVHTRHEVAEDRAVVFMFPGQGAQYVNMGQELYETQSVFREQVDFCAELLQPHMGLDILEFIYPSEEEREAASRELNQTYLTQPAIFVIEYALAKLWMEWGVQPEAMIGHSIGEYVAAVLADVLSLEDALKLLANRSRLMQGLPGGAMLAISLPEQEVVPLLGNDLSVAAVNGPQATVVAGTVERVEALQELLKERGVLAHRLETSHAFHSPMMEPILDEFLQHVQAVKFNAPTLPYLSSVTGKWITAADVTDPGYWIRQLRQEVRFADGVRELLQKPNRILLEVGPGRALGTMARQQAQEEKATVQVVLTSLRHRDEKQSDVAFLLNAFGLLWLNGANVDRTALYAGETRRRLALPTYPFERKRYYVERGAGEAVFVERKRVAGKLPDLTDWLYTPVWKQTVPPELLGVEDRVEKATWLVLADHSALASKLVDRLKQQGQTVVSVAVGTVFRQVEAGVYEMQPSEPSEYSLLIKQLVEQGLTPNRVIHCWNVRTAEVSSATSQDLGLYSMLYLAQAIGESGLTSDPIEITVVSNHLQEVAHEPIRFPERATVFGACQVLPQEYGNMSCSRIDLAWPLSSAIREGKLIEQLAAELMTPTSDEVVAYRGTKRFVQAYEKAKLTGAKASPLLRQAGVYLITGGADGAGFAVAEHLAKTLSAKLILVDGVPIAPEKREALETFGAQVMVSLADLANEEQMRAVVEQALERFGEIHGVIHTAETIGAGMVQLKTRDMVEAVLRPKVHGTLVLEKVCHHLELDFLALFSRMLGITGGFGQFDNAAANAFLGGFARYFTETYGTFAVAIDWGVWQFDELQLGQASLLPEVQQHMQQMQAEYGIRAEEGMEVFNRILSGVLPQVVVSTQDFQDVLNGLDAISMSNYMETMQKRGSREFDANRPYVAPTNPIEEQVAEIWRDIFGMEQVSIDDNFFDLGGNSLLSVQLVARLRTAFNTELPMSALFESASIAELAKVIEATQLSVDEMDELERLLKEIEGLSADEVTTKLTVE